MSNSNLKSSRFRYRWWHSLVLIFFAVLGYVLYQSSSLERRLDALRAAGKPVSIADFAVPIPADNNAAIILTQGRDVLDKAEKDCTELENSTFYLQIVEAIQSEREVGADAQRELSDWISDHSEAYAIVDEATQCESYVPLLVSELTDQAFFESLLSNIDDARLVARLNHIRFHAYIASSDLEAAGATAVAALRFSKLVEAFPSMTGSLSGIAVQGLAMDQTSQVIRAGSVSNAMAINIDSALASLSDSQQRLAVLEQERAFTLDSLAQRFIWPLSRTWSHDFLDWYEHQLSLADQPWHIYEDKIDESISKPNSWIGAGALIQLITPAIESYVKAHNRKVALAKCLRIFLAIDRHRLSVEDQITADTLSLPVEVLLDPFTGDSLVIEHRKESDNHQEGWWIYSVIDDGMDNGGAFEEGKDWGLSPPKLPQKALGQEATNSSDDSNPALGDPK